MKAARIALIHAVPMAIGPVAAAFEALWPEAERINLLDDSLSVDRQRAGALTPVIAARIAALAEYAQAYGAAKLYTMLQQVMDTPDIRKHLNDSAIDVVTSKSPEAFAAFLRAETERWAQLVKGSGATVD